MQIRPATSADWPSIYPFFTRIVEEGTSYAFPLGMSPEEAQPWWMEQPPGLTVVAVEGEAVLGSAKMGPNRPGRGSHVATASFMVDPDARGHGIGRALGEYMLAWAAAEGFYGIQFNAVVETNTAAVKLWIDLGFQIIGTVPEAFQHPAKGLVGLHVMYRPLNS